jgi:hypothetical protein
LSTWPRSLEMQIDIRVNLCLHFQFEANHVCCQDMKCFMIKLVEDLKVDDEMLSKEEKDLFRIACREAIRTSSSFRTISELYDKENDVTLQGLLNEMKRQVEEETKLSIETPLRFVEDVLIPAARKNQNSIDLIYFLKQYALIWHNFLRNLSELEIIIDYCARILGLKTTIGNSTIKKREISC